MRGRRERGEEETSEGGGGRGVKDEQETVEMLTSLHCTLCDAYAGCNW